MTHKALGINQELPNLKSLSYKLFGLLYGRRLKEFRLLMKFSNLSPKFRQLNRDRSCG